MHGHNALYLFKMGSSGDVLGIAKLLKYFNE